MIARFLFQSPGAIFHCVVDHGLWCMVYFREQKNLLAVILVPKNDFTQLALSTTCIRLSQFPQPSKLIRESQRTTYSVINDENQMKYWQHFCVQRFTISCYNLIIFFVYFSENGCTLQPRHLVIAPQLSWQTHLSSPAELLSVIGFGVDCSHSLFNSAGSASWQLDPPHKGRHS